MTKTEQKLIERVREQNDKGNLSGRPVTRKLEKSTMRFGGMTRSGPEIAAENKAFEKLRESGEIISVPYTKLLGGGFVVKGHPILVSVAAAMDITDAKRNVEEKTELLERAKDHLAQLESFVMRYGSKSD